MAEALDAGHASFWLEGAKLRGGWTLHRTRRPEAAVAADQAPRREADAATGRQPVGQDGRRCEPHRTAGAMKAVLTDERFSDPDWIFERKLDGIRCIAIRDGGRRAAALAQRPVAERPLSGDRRGAGRRRSARGSSSTARSSPSTARQPASRRGPARGFYYVFDVLWLDGEDVRDRPLRERKALLRDALRCDDPLRLTTYRNEAGEAMFEEACREGLGGRDRQARRQPLHVASARATG